MKRFLRKKNLSQEIHKKVIGSIPNGNRLCYMSLGKELTVIYIETIFECTRRLVVIFNETAINYVKETGKGIKIATDENIMFN